MPVPFLAIQVGAISTIVEARIAMLKTDVKRSLEKQAIGAQGRHWGGMGGTRKGVWDAAGQKYPGALPMVYVCTRELHAVGMALGDGI